MLSIQIIWVLKDVLEIFVLPEMKIEKIKSLLWKIQGSYYYTSF